jgi:hypothetical protein
MLKTESCETSDEGHSKAPSLATMYQKQKKLATKREKRATVYAVDCTILNFLSRGISGKKSPRNSGYEA